MQHGLQTDSTCNIQQCLELLANKAASVCTGLNGIIILLLLFLRVACSCVQSK